MRLGSGPLAWLEQVKADGKSLWLNGPAIEPARFPPVQNSKHLLRSLYVDLALRGKGRTDVEEVRGEILHGLEALD